MATMRCTTARPPVFEPFEPRLLLSADDFSVSVDWLYYSDNLPRELAPGFSSGAVSEGTYDIPVSDVLKLPSQESGASFTINSVRFDESMNVSNGKLAIGIGQPSDSVKPISSAAITIDGLDGDWSSVTDYIDDGPGRYSFWPSGGDVYSMKLAYGGGYLNILLDLDGAPASDLHYIVHIDSDADGESDGPGDYRLDINFDATWKVDTQRVNSSWQWVGVSAANQVAVQGNILEARVLASALGLPAPVDVTLDVEDWASGGECDRVSNNFQQSEGWVAMQGQDLIVGDATTWTLAGRFSDFANCTTGNAAYVTSLTTGSWDGVFLVPSVTGIWFTGNYQGTHYDHALVLEAGVEAGPDSEDYEWWWGPDEGGGLFFSGLDPASTAVDLKIVVSNGGATATFYYRINSGSPDVGGADWTELISHTTPAGHSPMLGMPEAASVVNLAAEYVSDNAPDLAVSVDLPGGSIWVPGDKIAVIATVTNVGADPASGPIYVELGVSNDDIMGNGDDEWDVDDLNSTVNLAAGGSKQFKFSLTIPPDVEPAGFYWLARINPDPSIGDANSGNNAAIAADPDEVVWKVGNFDPSHKPTTKLTVYGPDVGIGVDVPVTFSLSGGGYLEIVGGRDFDEFHLYNTTEKTLLKITTPSKMWTEAGNLIVEGPAKSIDATKANFGGDVIISGMVGTLKLGWVSADHLVSINDSGGPVGEKATCTISMQHVEDTALHTNGLPIKSLTVDEWHGGEIVAPWIGSLTAKYGDFDNTDVHLAGTGNPKLTLGNVKIAGQLHNSNWEITGDVGNIQVNDGISWSGITVHSALKSIKTPYFGDSSITVDGPVTNVAVDDWDDSDLEADSLKVLKTGEFYKGRLTLNGKYVDPGKPVLTNANVGDIINDDPDRGWEIGGNINSIKAGDVVNWIFKSSADVIKSVKLGALDTTTFTAVHAAINSFGLSSWDGGVLEADSVKSLKAGGNKKTGDPGDWGADVSLLGANIPVGKPTLGSATAAGLIDGTWNITGGAGSVKAGDFSGSWSGTFTGGVKSLASSDDLTGTFSALWVGSISAKDDAHDFQMTLSQTVDDKQLALGKMTVAGWMNRVCLISQGNLGTITTGVMCDSTVMACCSAMSDDNGDGIWDLLDPAEGEGFSADAKLKSLTIKGIKGEQYWLINSNIAVSLVDSITAGYALTDPDPSGEPFGLACSYFKKLTYTDPVDGKVVFTNPDPLNVQAPAPNDNMVVRII